MVCACDRYFLYFFWLVNYLMHFRLFCMRWQGLSTSCLVPYKSFLFSFNLSHTILLAQWLILYRQTVGNSNQTTNKNLYRPCIYLHHSLIMNISWGMQTYATIIRRFLSSSSSWKKRRKKTKDEVPNHNTDYNRPQKTSHIYY